MNPLIFLLLTSILLSISGCATLSREDCMQGSWFELGLHDGRMGKPFNRLAQHQKSCLEFNIHIDSKQYNAGRKQGLQTFCQLDNAIHIGLKGQLYQSVCPPEIHSAFQRYNDAAYGVYQSQENLKRIDDELFNMENRLLNNSISDKEHSKIMVTVRRLDRERQRLLDELYSREHSLDHLLHD